MSNCVSNFFKERAESYSGAERRCESGVFLHKEDETILDSGQRILRSSSMQEAWPIKARCSLVPQVIFAVLMSAHLDDQQFNMKRSSSTLTEASPSPAGKRAKSSITSLEKKEICSYKRDHPSASQQDVSHHFTQKWGKTVGRSTISDILKAKVMLNTLSICLKIKTVSSYITGQVAERRGKLWQSGWPCCSTSSPG